MSESRQFGQENYRSTGEFVVTLLNNTQKQLAVSTTAASTPVIDPGGNYDVWCTSDVYLTVGGPTVTVNNGYLLKAGNIVTIHLPVGFTLQAILSAGTGTLSYFKVN